MNIAQRVCSLLMDSYKLHAALCVDVLYIRIHFDGFNDSKHPMNEAINYGMEDNRQTCSLEIQNSTISRRQWLLLSFGTERGFY